MNLIWITPEFPSSKRNIKGIYIYRTVKELAKYYKIIVICLYPAAPPILEMLKYWKDRKNIYNSWKSNYYKNLDEFQESDNLSINYIRYFRLPRGKFLHIEGWFAYFKAKKLLQKKILPNSIVHANWIFPAGTLASIISRKYKIPFIISLLGSDVNKLIVGSRSWVAAQKLLEKANKITSVTNDLFDKCKEKNIIIEESKKALIDNIYEPNKFVIKERNSARTLLGISLKIKMIYFAGGLIPIKNVDILIEALHSILKSDLDVKLYIAGSGTDEGKLKRLVENKNLGNSVFFVGNQLDDGMVNFFNAADIFCLPSKSEGLPNVIVESFFCGTPVVASAVGGIPSIVVNGKNGYLAAPNSIKDLAAKIELALGHDWDRIKIRESISFLLPELVIEKYKNIYSILEESSTLR